MTLPPGPLLGLSDKEERESAMGRNRDIEAEDYYEMACEWIRAGEPGRAEECLIHTIRLNQRFIHAYIDLAALYNRQKRYQESVHAMRKALRHDPGFHQLYYLLAVYSFRNGEYGSSLRTIDRAIQLNPCRLYNRVRAVIERHHRKVRL